MNKSRQFAIKMEDGEYFQFRLDNEGLHEFMQSSDSTYPNGQPNPFEILWCFSATHRLDTDCQYDRKAFRKALPPLFNEEVTSVVKGLSEALEEYSSPQKKARAAGAKPSPSPTTGAEENISPTDS